MMQRRFNPCRASVVRGRLRVVWAATWVALLWTLGAPSEAHAYPWLIRHGYTNCGACHADPSGGELLTIYGQLMSVEVLSSRWGRQAPTSRRLELRKSQALTQAAHAKNAFDPAVATQVAPNGEASFDEADSAAGELNGAEGTEDASDPGSTESSEDSGSSESDGFEDHGALAGPVFGLVPATERLLFGGSLRLASLYAFEDEEDPFRFFPMQIDVYAQARLGSALRAQISVGAIRVPSGSPHGRAAQVTANQGDGFNLISRTHWIGYDLNDGAHTIRVGRLNVPFGIRIPEHVMWVRERTQTDRESDQQHGIALYMGFEKLRFEVMGILGNYQVSPDAFRERGYAGYVEYVMADRLVLGLSSMVTRAGSDRTEPGGLAVTRQAHGPFLRAALSEDVAVLAEADLLLRSARELGYVGFLQVDAEPIRGLHLLATGEILDVGYPDSARRMVEDRVAGRGKPEAGGWFSVQWFFLPHFDMRVDLILRNDTQLLSQLHVYL